jgi:hypothetical protein
MSETSVVLPPGFEALVWVWRPWPWKAQAICDCGFKGPVRVLGWSARRDTLQHPNHVTPAVEAVEAVEALEEVSA